MDRSFECVEHFCSIIFPSGLLVPRSCTDGREIWLKTCCLPSLPGTGPARNCVPRTRDPLTFFEEANLLFFERVSFCRCPNRECTNVRLNHVMGVPSGDVGKGYCAERECPFKMSRNSHKCVGELVIP